MPHDSLRELDLSLEDDAQGYDPLADSEDNEDYSDPGIAQTSHGNDSVYPSALDARSPLERTAALFDSMPQRRRVLMGILSFLQTPQSADALKDEVDRMQEFDMSVYNSANYASLLEKSCAIDKVTEDGTPFAEAEDQEPEIVEVDGIEYYKPIEGRQVFWQNSTAGQEYLDADKPLERLVKLLDNEAVYAPIYRKILDICSVEGGVPAADIAAQIDSDPLLTSPRLYATSFLNKLEGCDAVVWEGTWKTTDVGKQGMQRLAETESEG